MKTKWSIFLAGILVGLATAVVFNAIRHYDKTRAQHYGPDYATFDITEGSLKPVWPK